jgi:hypothetical protein
MVFGCFAQDAAVADEQAVMEQPQPEFPYFAEITGDNVYIRSGPGTNYYRCDRLNRGDIVKVVSATNLWSQIVPPRDAFSWISKQYVQIDAEGPDIGVVTGDEVRVYAGSKYYEPIHSDQVQVHLNRGDKVALMGEEMGDYYKIRPPSGAFFWVTGQYTNPIDVTAEPVREETQTQETEKPQAEEQEKPKKEESTVAVVPSTMSAASERLEKYYAQQDLIKSELNKPLSQQDYTKIKKSLNELIAADGSDKAARFAKFALEQIKRYELAAAVHKEDEMQDSELQENLEKINEAQKERLDEFQDLGRFAVVGKLRTSNVYGPEDVLLHYIVADEQGKIICYALPTGDANNEDLDQYVGQKVGLIGKIEPHPQTSGALVKFTGIETVR